MFDDRDTIIRKIKRAVTDSGSEVRYAEGKHGINNLMTIYSCFTGRNFAEIEKDSRDWDTVRSRKPSDSRWRTWLGKYRKSTNAYLADKDFLDGLMKQGAERAALLANRTLSKVYKKVGFYRP